MCKKGASAKKIKEYLDKPSHRVCQVGEAGAILGLYYLGGHYPESFPTLVTSMPVATAVGTAFDDTRTGKRKKKFKE